MDLPRTRDAIAALIPHQGAMCLWDEVRACDEASVHCASRRHRDAGQPLRLDGKLAAVHAIEYAAQLMAIHGALAGGEGARPGVLAALRDVKLHAEFLDGVDTLEGHAQRVVLNGNGAMYQCRVEGDGRVLLTARISVIHPAA